MVIMTITAGFLNPTFAEGSLHVKKSKGLLKVNV